MNGKMRLALIASLDSGSSTAPANPSGCRSEELRRKTEEKIGHRISDQAFRIGLYLADLEVTDRVKLPLWQENVTAWWREDLLRLEQQIAEQKFKCL